MNSRPAARSVTSQPFWYRVAAAIVAVPPIVAAMTVAAAIAFAGPPRIASLPFDHGGGNVSRASL
jgi:hypothetical protein